MSDFSPNEVAVLKALAAGLLNARGVQSHPSGNGGQSSSTSGNSGEALDDAQLDKPWADRRIEKDLPRWSGASMVGRLFSEAPSEWHESAAGFSEYKARKGREESPVRLDNKGRPWHESDTFRAKLHRAWARRNAGKMMAPAATAPANGIEAGFDPIDDVPF